MEDQPTTSESTSSKIDDVFNVLDHLTARMTASAFTGMGFGAIFSTYKGLPMTKTSLSAAASCALISTACFGAERLAYGLIHQVTGEDSTTDSNILYGSHLLGGICGGAVVGYLYQRNPFRGMILFTPIMLGIGKLEITLDEYRASRIQQMKETD